MYQATEPAVNADAETRAVREPRKDWKAAEEEVEEKARAWAEAEDRRTLGIERAAADWKSIADF